MSRSPCPKCNNSDVIIHQYRNNRLGEKIVYRCKKCRRIFTPKDAFFKKRINDKVKDDILRLKYQGAKNKEIIEIVKERNGINYSRQTIWDIYKKFGQEFKLKYIKEILDESKNKMDYEYGFLKKLDPQLIHLIRKNLFQPQELIITNTLKQIEKLFKRYIQESNYKKNLARKEKIEQKDWNYKGKPIDCSRFFSL